MKTAPLLALLLSAASVLVAQTVASPATPSGLSTPPTRSPNGPGAPDWTVMGDGMNAPADRNGDFEIGPGYRPPPQTVAGTPQGTVQQFTMDSRDSKLYPASRVTSSE